MEKKNQLMHIAIGVPTCNRLIGLQRLLTGIDSLRFRKAPVPEISVIVVENGLKRGAEEIVRLFEQSSGLHYHYIHEPRPGIPFARNAVLEGAGKIGSEFLAFIDDDEVPEELWLDEALSAMKEFQADVVAGPVLPVFPQGTAKWLTRSEAFQRRRFKSGTLIRQAATCNVVIKLNSPLVLGHRFVEAFPFSGGTDTIFFRQLVKRGVRIVWCDSAFVHEHVGKERARPKAVLQRAFRLGTNSPVIEAAVNGRSGLQALWCLFAFGRISVGLCECIIGVFRGRVGLLRGGRMIARGCGVLSGVFGHQFDEYQKRHR